MIPLPRKALRRVDEYIPGEQPQTPDFIKLNTNENPYPPSPAVIQTIKNFNEENARRYPDPLCIRLRQYLSEKFSLNIDQIIIGNGSDEILRLLTDAYLDEDDKVAFLNPTYTFFATLAQMREAEIIRFNAIGSDLPIEIAKTSAKMIIIANPNPPFGTFYPPEIIARVCSVAKKTLVVIDEAYVDFATTNCIPLLKHFKNLVVTRSLSKSYALAGLRVGFGVGNSAIIKNLFLIKDSYNINALSQLTALAALKDYKYYAEKIEEIKRERTKMRESLIRMGFDVPESQGNFIFAMGKNPLQIYTALKERKILVRYLTFPKLVKGIRISIGTPKQNKKLMKEIKDII